MKKYYLAYGSNLNKEQMAIRCPEAELVGSGQLPGYELVFRRGYLTIEAKEGSSVPVGLWKISATDEKALDRYEGFPTFYGKYLFSLSFMGIEGIAMAYIMRWDHPIQAPTDAYFYTVYHGYTEFGFDKGPLTAAYERAKYG